MQVQVNAGFITGHCTNQALWRSMKQVPFSLSFCLLILLICLYVLLSFAVDSFLFLVFVVLGSGWQPFSCDSDATSSAQLLTRLG